MKEFFFKNGREEKNKYKESDFLLTCVFDKFIKV